MNYGHYPGYQRFFSHVQHSGCLLDQNRKPRMKCLAPEGLNYSKLFPLPYLKKVDCTFQVLKGNKLQISGTKWFQFLFSFKVLVNKNHQKVILTGLPIFLGERVAAHTHSQATTLVTDRCMTHICESWTFTHLNIAPFWKTFVTGKTSTIFKSGLYGTFSNSTTMNKNKQVSHSKQETISVIFTHPSPNPSAPQNIVWLIWPNRKFQKLLLFYGS